MEWGGGGGGGGGGGTKVADKVGRIAGNPGGVVGQAVQPTAVHS